MFSKSQTKNDPSADAAAPSIVSVDMRVSGDLKSSGDVQVDGVVDGDIHSSTLSIGKTAEVNGGIEATSVRIWGRVNGRIKAKHVTLLETAEVSGDIVHETLEVASGAFVEGMMKRDRKQDEDRPAVNLVVAAGETAADAGTAEKTRTSGFPIKAKASAKPQA